MLGLATRRLAVFWCMVWLAGTAGAMTFSPLDSCGESSCRTVILGSGTIDQETPEAFDEVARKYPDAQKLIMTSKGGSLAGGLKLGQKIRARQFDTEVSGDCFSACAYAFLGGVQRHVPEGARLGVHQFRSGGENQQIDAERAQKISAVLGAYFDQLGIDRKFLDVALATPTNKVMVFTPEQLTALKVDNHNNPGPAWRIEATEGGDLLALVSQPFPGHPKQSLSVAIMSVQKRWRLLVLVKGAQSGVIYEGLMPLTLELNGRSTVLSPLTTWQTNKSGYQVWYTLSDETLQQLVGLSDADRLALVGRWPGPSSSDQNPRAIRLSTHQIRKTLTALRKTAPGS